MTLVKSSRSLIPYFSTALFQSVLPLYLDRGLAQLRQPLSRLTLARQGRCGRSQ